MISLIHPQYGNSRHLRVGMGRISWRSWDVRDAQPGVSERMDEQQNQLVDGALTRLPSGCYLMTAANDGVRSGMLVHSVVQCCADPMLICVAARKGHKIDPLIRDSRSFAIGIVEPSDKLVARRFRSTDSVPTEYLSVDEDDPFDAVETQKLVTGSPILMRCMTWFDCEVLRRIDLESEMELFVGVVVAVMHNNEQVQIERDSSLNGLD